MVQVLHGDEQPPDTVDEIHAALDAAGGQYQRERAQFTAFATGAHHQPVLVFGHATMVTHPQSDDSIRTRMVDESTLNLFITNLTLEG